MSNLLTDPADKPTGCQRNATEGIPDDKKLVEKLQLFGLSQDESQIYFLLCKSDDLSALQIHRKISIPRSRVYRKLDKLIHKGLVLETICARGKKFRAASCDRLELILLEKQNNIDALKQSLPQLTHQLNVYSKGKKSDSDVLYYSGVEGLKQITWNSLKANEELLIYELASSMNPFSGIDFAEKVRQEFFSRGIITKQLTNLKKFGAFTKVQEYVDDCMKARYISPKKLKIDFEILIYNDTIASYTYRTGDIFGVEVKNDQLAKMHKQLFDFVWKQARKMTVGKGGRSSIRL